MKKIYFTALLAILLPAIFMSCSGVSFRGALNDPSYSRIWAFSDIQPRTEKEREDFENLVSDAQKSFPQIDVGIIAGDIVQRGNNEVSIVDYEWFFKERAKLSVNNWFEIAGNHDARNIKNYKKYTGKNLDYAVLMGNILMIFLSDESGATSGSEVSDPIFAWWKELVISNQDKNIFTITHSHLAKVGFPYAFVKYRNVDRSERFTEVIKKYHVDLWLCGHSHVPSSLGMNEFVSKESGTLFVNIASVRTDYPFSHPESRLILLKKDSNILVMLTRYHDKQKFMSERTVEYKMNHPFEWDGTYRIIESP